jgi:hypothetical protein
MSEPAGNKAAESGSTTFWKTVPGILTGVAALLTAIGGLIVVLAQVFGTPEQNPPADPGARPTAVSAAASPSSPAGELRRHSVEMNGGDFIDLETGKLGKWTTTSDFYMVGGDRLTTTPYPATLASGPVTKATCRAALQARDDAGAEFSRISDDQWLCLETEEKHLAGVRIVRRPSPGDPVAGLEYVVWK